MNRMENRANGDSRPAAPSSRPAAVRRSLAMAALALSLVLGGCRSNDLLENELRARDFQYRELLDELKKSEFHNEALQRELQAIRQGRPLSPEQAAQTFTLKRITLGFLTKGIDNDKVPGDEALQVVVEPRDGEDHIIKAPGSIQVIAQEVSPEGVKFPLATWDLGASQVRQHWKQGLIGSGYQFTLPWQQWPKFENIRVTVRFVLPDNRVFEADKDVKLRLPPRDLLPRPAPAPEEPSLPPVESTSQRVSFKQNGKTPPPAGNWQPGPGTLPPSPQPGVVIPQGHWQRTPLRQAVQLLPPEPVND